MLTIISDTHLTDGSTGDTVSSNAFEIFAQRLREMAYRGSFDLEKKYHPLKVIDLLLLGDVFDLIRSMAWLVEKDGMPVTVKPWDDPQSERYIKKIESLTQDIITNNKTACNILKSLSSTDPAVNPILLPPATQAGKPDMASTVRLSVNVRLHYLVGNHDWFYHLPGPAYNKIRQMLVDALGLTNPADKPFPHDPTESPSLMKTYFEHGLFARHGDLYDAFNYDANAGRAAPSVGDAIVIQLLEKYRLLVSQTMADDLPREYIIALNELDHIRPSLALPIWLGSLSERAVTSKSQVKELKKIWDGLVDELLALPYIKSKDKFLWPDMIDALEAGLKFSKLVPSITLGKWLKSFQEKFLEGGGTWAKFAGEEAVLKDTNNPVQFVVYGHTHHAEVVPLDTVYTPDRIFDQIYFNSGTWRQVYELTRLNQNNEEFVGYHMMSYLTFYRPNERSGHPFDYWTGILGIPSNITHAFVEGDNPYDLGF